MAVKSFESKLSGLRARASRGAGPLGPVVGSTIGILWESAGLVCNVAGLGIALVSDTGHAAPKKAEPQRPTAPAAGNVIPFPAKQRTKPASTNRGRS
jgi:hypothetical protein